METFCYNIRDLNNIREELKSVLEILDNHRIKSYVAGMI